MKFLVVSVRKKSHHRPNRGKVTISSTAADTKMSENISAQNLSTSSSHVYATVPGVKTWPLLPSWAVLCSDGTYQAVVTLTNLTESPIQDTDPELVDPLEQIMKSNVDITVVFMLCGATGLSSCFSKTLLTWNKTWTMSVSVDTSSTSL